MAWSRIHYGRIILCRAANSHGKGQLCLGKAFAGRPRTAKVARQHPAWQSRLCRAPFQPCTAKAIAVRQRVAVCCDPLPCDIGLPCALNHCHAQRLARARQRFERCRAQLLNPVRQRTCQYTSMLPGLQVGDAWLLCRVQVTICPLPCAYTRQRGRQIFCFIYICIISCIQTNIYSI